MAMGGWRGTKTIGNGLWERQGRWRRSSISTQQQSVAHRPQLCRPCCCCNCSLAGILPKKTFWICQGNRIHLERNVPSIQPKMSKWRGKWDGRKSSHSTATDAGADPSGCATLEALLKTAAERLRRDDGLGEQHLPQCTFCLGKLFSSPLPRSERTGHPSFLFSQLLADDDGAVRPVASRVECPPIA